MTPGRDQRRLARARDRAAKAQAKAARPWHRKPRSWLLGGMGLLILAIVLSVVFGKTPKTTGRIAAATRGTGASSTSSVSSGPTTAPPTTTAPATTSVPTTTAPISQVGQTVKDGDLAFVVQGMTCGAQATAAVNAEVFGETVPAGAQECLVTMTVADDKGTSQTFFDSNQYAYDAAGRRFSADSQAAIYLTGANDDTQINPGITVTAVVPFQIPIGDTIVKLDLHDSVFSGGVTVRV